MIEVQGYLWVRDNGSPLLVTSKRNFVAERNDPVVPNELVRPMHLESGVFLDGKARSGDRPRMVEIEASACTAEPFLARLITRPVHTRPPHRVSEIAW